MKKILFVCGIALFIFALSVGAIGQSEGAEDSDISGYAWSSNVGWISFKGIAANGNSYGVRVDQQGGLLSGLAWSSNIGWITFNQSDLTGCPTSPCRAKLNGNAFTGWAKATAANGNGWDGWISLSGTATNGSTYGLTYGNNIISGLMWGGPVVGFIDVEVELEILPPEDTCANDIDDDSDGYIDTEDMDCDGGNDEEDTYNPECDNNKDDDNDDAVDHGNDVGCSSLSDDSEVDSSNAPQVNIFVGISSPSFEVLNLGKDGGSVLLGIEVSNASSTTNCTRTIIVNGNATVVTIPTGGNTNFETEQSLTITAPTKIVVRCATGSYESSDSADIILKSENEF